jgi:UDP:flavonoid glycosyltransferase YjiC (YdhE family)
VSRFLFVTLPLVGHVNPALGLARELSARGHDVAWAGSEMSLRSMVGPDATIFPTGSRLFREQGGAGMAAFKSLWARFILPYNKFILAGVERAVQAFEPDVLLVDQHAVAGAMVAHRHGLPWATVVCSAMELTDPYRGLPRITDWTRSHLVKLWAEADLPPADFFDVRMSPYLAIGFTTEALTAHAALPPQLRLVGPAPTERPGAPMFPFELLDPDRQHVLVTMGTLAKELATDFYTRAVDALRPLGDRLQAVIVAPPDDLPEPPDHILVAAGVPMLTLLPHVDAVVSHGGLNTVTEALSNGIPLVVAPIRHDQPVVAEQVVAAGAGIRVRFRRVRAAELAGAVTAVLDDPSYRAAAGRVADSFRAAGGAAEAANLVERLQETMSDKASIVVPPLPEALA